jgi:hypothetical protein
MEKTLKPSIAIGDAVEFVDPYGKSHNALVTSVFSVPGNLTRPSVNVVYIADDETMTDQYGRQIERKTSVVHESNQAAHGMFWRDLG